MPEAVTATATALRWMTQRQCACYLGISVKQVQLLSKAGKLPCSRMLGPKTPRYDRQQLDQFLAGNN